MESLYQVLGKGPLRVAILGSGNWGCAVARAVALNTKESYLFHDEVKMWTYEETLEDGRLISQVINNEHENVIYLPGVKLPSNLLAVTDVVETAKDADLLIMIVPHQFVSKICDQLAGKIKPTARAVTFVKGLDIHRGIPRLFSDVITEKLGVECDAVSGANVAKDVAADQFCEATIGYKNADMASIWQQLFDRPTFRMFALPDVAGVQVCGALKNLVAMAVGFCDGMNLGTNTKSAIMRLGMVEMKLFASLFFDDVLEDTYSESAGIADLVTTCFGGRNVRCAAEFVKRGNTATWEEVERDLLKGQKMQGQLTCKEVHDVLEANKVVAVFPLFHQSHEIAFNGAPPESLLDVFMKRPVAQIKTHADCRDAAVPQEYGKLKAKLRAKLRRDHMTSTTPSTLSSA